MTSLGTIKRGDTFVFTADITDEATSAALTGAAAKLKCQGKYKDTSTVLVEMAVAETVTAGTYSFTATSTAAWVVGRMVEFDIQYTSDGRVSSTDTFYVYIEGDVTDG